MNNQLVMVAGGGMVVGVLLAVAISGSMADKKIARALSATEEGTASAVAEASDALSTKLADLETAMTDGAAAASDAVEERLAAIEADFSGKIDALSQSATQQADDVKAMIDALMAAASATAAGETPEATGMASSDALSVGQTAVFADGAVRVFVSALDRDAGTARLSVNGEMHSVGAGATAPASFDGAECSVALMSVGAEGAVIGSDCGSTAGEATAGASVPPPPAEGYAPGTVAALADGALRVFVSSLAADGSAARLAINGIDTQLVASGSTVEVAVGDKTCNLTVTGVGDGLVGLDGSCG